MRNIILFIWYFIIIKITFAQNQTNTKSGQFCGSDFTKYLLLFEEADYPNDNRLLYKHDLFNDDDSLLSGILVEIDTAFYSYIHRTPFFIPYAWLKITCDFGYLIFVCNLYENKIGELCYIDIISYDKQGSIIGFESLPYRKRELTSENRMCFIDGILFLNSNHIKYYIIGDENFLRKDNMLECQEYDFEILKNGKQKKSVSKYRKTKKIRWEIGEFPKQVPIDFQIQ